ncbi:MAG: hypothetical protein A2365_03585 [Candidatus Nealsonbacteria bacterium RIFOXYB1_FULL_40_15]|uniref:Uncharacterized protein n=2 Tax=Candidatus Nealsoniibacteriota TaxID=1817911 RepID=A0A1G2ERG6_9BACT|nr:MAG: hypothetical protein A2365_03585 [Candidatus Nealsonbacteria bacterium RIFOXYB1_FULL_40_15]OGZ28386.1 MAG: hypothetical protein A2427_01270 [Candidatus Nealsonbacteria bacterium RIFOXYC1_FULL_40_7]OGZ29511.1 MAG: hypothetical protein A2562_02360 [Candidatus Nealsonbacteria bacterium RIFOXYD1_FULL_39_11]
MKISVKARAGSKKESIEEKEGFYIVSVKAMPEKGLANEAILKALRRHFKSEARIISGFSSKKKIVEIY